MRIVLSRKGFDSSAGGGPSPIVGGRALTLPIPAGRGPSLTTYAGLGLGEAVQAASRGRIGPADRAHHDPLFLPDGRAVLGQCGAAQTHLERQGVSAGDLFLFFGLFRDGQGERHHRIFGYLRVEEVLVLANAPAERLEPLRALGFPHAIGLHARNDCAWMGRGQANAPAHPALRLTAKGGPLTRWAVPGWLAETGLSWHPPGRRWAVPGELISVSRGQEFVIHAGERPEPRRWAEAMMALIEG